MTKLVTDLLIFDAGAIEAVFNGVEVQLPNGEKEIVPGEELEEYVALRGSDVVQVVDPHGRILGYQQDIYGDGIVQVVTPPGSSVTAATDSVTFLPRQIIFFRLFPSTSTLSGQPLIEVLINEIITMMRQSEHSMLAFDADEIPPGILVITGVAGAAADAAKQDLRRLRGKDHKVRVVTSPDPNATGARWVELRHTPKDLEFTQVIQEIRRTIWRVFGVLPIEMGDSENIPRSVGRVQLEVSSNQLISPILEIIESKVNTSMLPVMLGDDASQVTFQFDRETKLTAQEFKHKTDSLNTLVAKGIISRNEARKELDMSPVAGGDTLTIDTPTGPIPLVRFVPTPEEIAEPGDEDPEEGSEGIEVSHGNEEVPDELSNLQERNLIDSLPSEWQPRGMFKNVRTIELLPLWELTARYTRSVSELYDAAMAEAVAIVGSSFMRGSFDSDAASVLNQRLAGIVGRLEVQWSADTRRYYLDAAQIGRDTATDYTGRQVQDAHRDNAQVYWARAMGFLTQPGGLTAALRAQLLAMVAGLSSPESRSIQGVNMSPPQGVRDECRRGIKWYEDGEGGDGLVPETIRWARKLAAGDDITEAKVRKMRAWLARHEVDKQGKGFNPGEDGYPSPGRVAWALWGGDPAVTWSNKLVEQIDRNEGSKLSIQTRQLEAEVPEEAVEASTGAEAAAVTAGVFARERHRITNWAGKLIELANETMVSGLREGGSEAGITGAVEWYVEWVNVGDSEMCPVCTRLGSAGFIPLANLPTVPGGATRCGANCRCVLVLWREDEVKDGTAFPLSGTAP